MTTNTDTISPMAAFHEGVAKYQQQALDNEKCVMPELLARYTFRYVNTYDDGTTFIWDAEITDCATDGVISVRFHSEAFGNMYEVDWEDADTLSKFEQVAEMAFPNVTDSLATDCVCELLQYVADAQLNVS
ncbi:MAG: hypothetical protein ACO3O3_07000 [Ilumatobacteraceae bacterium]